MGAYESGKVYAIPVQDAYVVGPPIWEDHWERGRNWLARLEEAPTKPGGVTRTWCERGRGRFYYSIDTLVEGDTIEFGADRLYASTDGRARVRWYGEIVRITDTKLCARYFETIKEMFSTICDRELRVQEVPDA